jgi:hypothetical protein
VTIREHRQKSARTQKLSESMRRRAHRAERRAGIIVTICRADMTAQEKKDEGK